MPLAPTVAARAARPGCGHRGRRAAGRRRPGGPRRGGLPTPGRIGVQERQGDLGAEPGEDLLGAGPVGVQQRAKLVAGRGLGGHMIVTQPRQRLQLPGSGIQGTQPAQPVPIGAQVVGELEAVAGIGLGCGRTPAGPGGVEGVGVDGNDGVAGGQQPVHDQTAWPLDRHRQLFRWPVAGQTSQRRFQPQFGVLWCPPVHDVAGVVDHGHVVCGAGPVPSHEHRRLLDSMACSLAGCRGPGCRCLIVRPLLRACP